jgi:NADH-quinone oxidoreductase subunit J
MNVTAWIAGALAVIGALLAVTRRNAVHALLYLISAMMGVAVVLFVYGAALAAVLQVIVWAGAIMVLFLFVMMMLNLKAEPRRRPDPRLFVGPAILTALLAAVLGYVLIAGSPGTPATSPVDPKAVGVSLYGPYALAVELASVLLLVGVAGAFHLARSREATADRGEKERVSE